MFFLNENFFPFMSHTQTANTAVLTKENASKCLQDGIKKRSRCTYKNFGNFFLPSCRRKKEYQILKLGKKTTTFPPPGLRTK